MTPIHHLHFIGNHIALIGATSTFLACIAAAFALMSGVWIFWGLFVTCFGLSLQLLVRSKALSNGRRVLANAPCGLASVAWIGRQTAISEWRPIIVCYSKDEAIVRDPEALSRIAFCLSGLRGKKLGDPQLDAIGAAIRSRSSELNGMKLPPSIVEDAEVHMTILYLQPKMWRRHIVRVGSVLPMLISQDYFCLVPPKVYAGQTAPHRAQAMPPKRLPSRA